MGVIVDGISEAVGTVLGTASTSIKVDASFVGEEVGARVDGFEGLRVGWRVISTVTRDVASTCAPTWLATSEMKSSSVRDDVIEEANSESTEELISANDTTTSKLVVHENTAKILRRCRNDV